MMAVLDGTTSNIPILSLSGPSSAVISPQDSTAPQQMVTVSSAALDALRNASQQGAPTQGLPTQGAATQGSPSGGPYSGGGQPAGGQPGNVDDQFARTWPEFRKEWKDWYDRWVKPYVETARDELAPPALPIVRDVLDGTPPAARAIIIAREERRIQELIGNGADQNGPELTRELEELQRLKELGVTRTSLCRSLAI